MVLFFDQNNKIREHLSRIVTPGQPNDNDIISGGTVQSITHHKGIITLVLDIPPFDPITQEKFHQNIITAVKKSASFFRPVRDVRIIHTAQRSQNADNISPPGKISHLSSSNSTREHKAIHIDQDKKAPMRDFAPGVKHIIAVASGKGGVGKSSIAMNLACALSRQGHRVGLMDADIYGPSQARMMGLEGRPETIETETGKMLLPLIKHGVKVMSMAFMVEENRALIWRGLMIQSAIQQFLRDVEWGELDILVVDMPPGTGDAALTLAQKVPLAGAVVVSTPQDIALIDASRAVAMFEKVNTPVLGMIENMSVYCCPNCGHQDTIFGHHGARERARTLNVPFWGELPLDKAIREACDTGEPFVISYPDSPYAEKFNDFSKKMMDQIKNISTALPQDQDRPTTQET